MTAEEYLAQYWPDTNWKFCIYESGGCNCKLCKFSRIIAYLKRDYQLNLDNDLLINCLLDWSHEDRFNSIKKSFAAFIEQANYSLDYLTHYDIYCILFQLQYHQL